MSETEDNPTQRSGMIDDLLRLPRPFYLLLAGSFINRFGHFVIPFLAIYLRQLGFAPSATGYALAAYGFLLGLNGIMIVFMEMPLTNWTRRRDAQRVMALGYALMGGGLALLAFGSGITMLVLAMVVLTIGEMVSSPVASSYMANLAPDDVRGRYMGFGAFSWNIAAGIGPMTGLWLYGMSPQMLWLSCGVLGLGAAWLILVRAKRLSTILKQACSASAPSPQQCKR